MKAIFNVIAVCADVALAGCSSTKSTSVAPGAVGEKSGCCSAKTSGCCADKAKTETSMGAMGEKSSCTKTCPMTGKTQTVSPGAVSDTKSGCCASKAKASCATTGN